MNESVDNTLSQKMDENLILSLCGDDWSENRLHIWSVEVFLVMLRRFNLGFTQMNLLNEYTAALRSMTKEKNITFGVSEMQRNER